MSWRFCDLILNCSSPIFGSEMKFPKLTICRGRSVPFLGQSPSHSRSYEGKKYLPTAGGLHCAFTLAHEGSDSISQDGDMQQTYACHFDVIRMSFLMTE
jgi:hypothetical protein